MRLRGTNPKLFDILLLSLLAMALLSQTTATTLESWSNCSETKDLWHDSARWSSSPATSSSSGKIPLYIAGFLPFSSEFFDQLVCTVLMAVEHVNDDPNLLADYELRFIWNWTQALPGPALQLFYDMVYNSPQVVMAWGPTYSRVGEVLNRVAAQYHLVQVGIAQFQANEQLVETYPYTVQIYPANSVFNPARIALMREMKWKRAAIMYQNVNLFRDEMVELATMMQGEGLNTISIETVNEDPRTNIQSLKRHDARIIFLSVYQDMATKVFCEAYRQGLYGPKYVWILIGWYHAGWWRIETTNFRDRGEEFCTFDQMDEAVEGYLSMRGFEIQEDLSKINFNGIYPDEDRLEFFHHLQGELLFSGACDSYGYDQIMTIALALNSSTEVIASRSPGSTLADFTYTNTEMADIFLHEAKNVKFVGLTGPVAFDSVGSRESNAVIQQLQNQQVEQIFVFDRETDTIRLKRDFQWGGSIVPVDGPTEQLLDVHINNANRIVISALAGLGIILAIIFLSVNIVHRKKRALKISSPMLNNVISIGGIFLYCSTYLLSESLEVQPQENSVLTNIECQAALLVASVGLSMSFGALFMKTYRIHQIYTSAMKVRKVLKGLTDSRLLFAISWFIIIDLAFFAFWMSYDPMTTENRTYKPILDDTAPELEISFVPTLNICTSASMLPFMGALGVYKGGLLLFGVFLAWSTRKVRIMELNDSKYIALSVYTVCLTCVIAVPFAYIFYSRGDINYVFTFVGGAIVFATTVVLCLVFVPKLMAINDPASDTKGRPLTMATSTDTTFDDKDATLQRLQRALQQKLQERKDLLEELAMLDRIYMQSD
ncbi:gamma-aminobutyric acid type B receptor subunit 2-like [Lytechinus variegatus]|uniref:gamma-aminobutyric acid type B receptor subunit 2-like n=1 Tax=Lytechinus variegatus TaxID=7654 RepID=UPI001BB1EAA8|nr:gamma-aminobutyric acid type B receptor subunit 2-like [Lytechinus variegatus]